ncbi:hypothetical protein Tco_1555312 [Tanacetum coccineum]
MLENSTKRDNSHLNLRRQAQDDALRNLEAQIDQLRRQEHEVNLGANVNIMSESILEELSLADPKNANIIVEMADKTRCVSQGILENVLWKEDICTKWASCNPHFDECDGRDNPRENKEYWESTNDNMRTNLEWENLSFNNSVKVAFGRKPEARRQASRPARLRIMCCNSKIERKFKKPASPSKKKNLVAVEELVKKPAKKPTTRRESVAPATTIPSPIPPFISLQQQSTSIPTPTTIEATTSTTIVHDYETLSVIHLRVSDLEKEVKELKNRKYWHDLSKEHSIPTDVVEKLKQQDKPQKSAKDIRKVKMEQFILEDKDAMDKGTTKSYPKSTAKSTQAEEIVFEARDTHGPQNQGDDMGNTDEPPVVSANPKEWFKKPKRPPTPYLEWNECKTIDNKPTQKWLSDLSKAEKTPKTFDDLMSTLIDFSAFVMNCL